VYALFLICWSAGAVGFARRGSALADLDGLIARTREDPPGKSPLRPTVPAGSVTHVSINTQKDNLLLRG
jgi:hypothetical protein